MAGTIPEERGWGWVEEEGLVMRGDEEAPPWGGGWGGWVPLGEPDRPPACREASTAELEGAMRLGLPPIFGEADLPTCAGWEWCC